MNEYFDQGYNEGVKFACFKLGTPTLETVKAKNFNDTIFENSYMQKDLCKLACALLYAAGEDTGVEAELYNGLLNTMERGYTMSKEASEHLLGPVVEALGMNSVIASNHPLVKQAGGFVDTMADVAKSGITIGGIGGASIGALAWLLNRNADQKDEEIDVKREQAKHYRAIAKDIKERLKAKAEDLKETANDMGEGAYIM